MQKMDRIPVKRSKKRFQRHWFDADETLKVWLKEFPSDESKCVCKVCNKTFGCGLTEIRKHSSTRAHKNNMDQLLHDNTLLCNEPDVEDNQSEESLQEGTSSRPLLNEIKIAEIRYAAFFVENNIATSVAPKFLALMQDIGKNPAVLQGMEIGRTKCEKIISNVLCVRETEYIADKKLHKESRLNMDIVKSALENQKKEVEEITLNDESDYPLHTSKDSKWCYMPNAILLNVLQYLTLKPLIIAGEVCKSWHRVSYDEFLWKNLFYQTYEIHPAVGMMPGKTSWFEEFKRLTYCIPLIQTEEWTEHNDEVLHVSFSHNGEMFATCSNDGCITVWKANILFK